MTKKICNARVGVQRGGDVGWSSRTHRGTGERPCKIHEDPQGACKKRLVTVEDVDIDRKGGTRDGRDSFYKDLSLDGKFFVQ